MPALSLFQLATQASVLHAKRIDDVGVCTYEMVRPMLLKLENPNTLRVIEQRSPHICGADAELWRNFIKRDVPKWQTRIIEPKDPKNWHKVYTKLCCEAEEELRQQSAALKAALSSHTADKQGNQTQIMNRVIQTSSKPRVATTVSRTGNSSLLTFSRGTRTKMTSGKDVLERSRREAREQSLRGRGALITPTHLLNRQAGQVRSVPKAMASSTAPSTPLNKASAMIARPTTGTAPSDSVPKEVYAAPRLSRDMLPPRRTGAIPPVRPQPPLQLAGKKRPAVDFLMAPKRPR